MPPREEPGLRSTHLCDDDCILPADRYGVKEKIPNYIRDKSGEIRYDR